MTKFNCCRYRAATIHILRFTKLINIQMLKVRTDQQRGSLESEILCLQSGYSLQEKLISCPQINAILYCCNKRKCWVLYQLKDDSVYFKQKDHTYLGKPKISIGPSILTLSFPMPVYLYHFSKLLTSGTYSTSIFKSWICLWN